MAYCPANISWVPLLCDLRSWAPSTVGNSWHPGIVSSNPVIPDAHEKCLFSFYCLAV
jgi:hypothetical protein